MTTDLSTNTDPPIAVLLHYLIELLGALGSPSISLIVHSLRPPLIVTLTMISAVLHYFSK